MRRLTMLLVVSCLAIGRSGKRGLSDGLRLWRDGEYQRLYPLAFPKEQRDECFCECE